LTTEEQLIEVARSKLQEALLKAFSAEDILKMRPYLVWWIKSIAKIRACSHIGSEEARGVVTSSIDNEKLNALFKFNGH
jgi:hypothetical protein